MTDENYTARFAVEQSPEAVFAAITNVRGWWSESVEGRTDVLGSTFKYRFRDIHRAEIRVTELVPGRRVAWHVVCNYFEFTKDHAEWTGTDMIFDIIADGNTTALQFTHVGLVPHFECFEVCSDGWGTYLGSLRSLIVAGKGNPNVGEAITGSEQALSA